MRESKALIVGSNKDVRDTLEQVFHAWDFAVETTNDPRVVVKRLQRSAYEVLVLDLENDDSGLLDNIKGISPDTPVIVLAHDESSYGAIKARSLQICAVVQTPPDIEALFRAVKQACEYQRFALENEHLLKELRHSREELYSSLSQLNQLTTQVTALTKDVAGLLGDQNPSPEEQQVHQKLRSLVLSVVNELRKRGDMKKYESQLELLESYIEELCSNIANDLEGCSTLSLAELRVASMIRAGMTTGSIAGLLHVSPDTVKTHRKNIRKKLHIVGTKNDLAAFLQAASGPSSAR